MFFYKQSIFCRSILVVATAFAFVLSQTAPALAYGPNDPFGGHNDIRAMVNFRLPLGVSQSDKERAPSFGFTVKRQLQFDDPLHRAFSGTYQNPQYLTVRAMDLRFGVDGRFSGLEVGGLNALQARKLLSAADNGNGGTPTWVWLALGGLAVVVVVAVVALDNASDDLRGLENVSF